jgi:hypothetical protein
MRIAGPQILFRRAEELYGEADCLEQVPYPLAERFVTINNGNCRSFIDHGVLPSTLINRGAGGGVSTVFPANAMHELPSSLALAGCWRGPIKRPMRLVVCPMSVTCRRRPSAAVVRGQRGC